MVNDVPRGFIPTQDKLYLIAGWKLPEGASISRSDAVVKQMVTMAQEPEGVAHVVSFAGLNPTQFTNTPNYAIAWVSLKKFEERHISGKQIADTMQAKLNTIQEGMAFVIMPPPILGLGNGAGYSLFVEDRAGSGYGVLQQGVGALQGALMKEPGMGFPFSGYQSNVPQVDMDVDPLNATTHRPPLTHLLETLQLSLPSPSLTHSNLFGRTWRVYAQAEG